MGTIRVEHSRNYTTIANQAIRDSRLSFKARGIHHLLLSYPNGWRVRIEHLVEQSERDGRDAIASGLRELKEHGYLIKRPKQDEKGRLMGWEDTILEIPESVPATENQETRKTEKPNNGKTVKRKNRKTENPNNGKSGDIVNNYEVTTSNEVITSEEVSRGEENAHTREFEPEILPIEPKPESALEQTNFPGDQNPELSLKPITLPLDQNSPAPLAKAETTAQRVKRAYETTGILPRIPIEIEAWVQEDLGSEIIALYRKSGRVTTTSQGDINPDFAEYVTAEYNRRNRDKKDIPFGYSYIRSLEWGEKRNWETLAALVCSWQLARQTGDHTLNIAQKVEQENWQKQMLENLSTGKGNDWLK